jgi:outer membrane lipoprotein carrier protein
MRRLMLTIVLLLCFVSSGHTRPLLPLEGLEALRKAFSGVTDFTAGITQEKRLALMKRTMTMNGTVRFRKPDLFYLEITSPYVSRMLLRDSTIEQVMGNASDRNRIVLPPEQGLKRWFSRISVPVSSLPEGMAVKADVTGQVYTVTISPQGKGQIKEVIVTFQEDGTVRRLVIGERSGDRAVMTFHKVRRNVGLTEKDFRLE